MLIYIRECKPGGFFTRVAFPSLYLRCYFRCKECATDLSTLVGRLYGAFNNILNVMVSSRNEINALHLIQTYCLQSLTYRCETWSLKTDDVKRVDVAWNDAFRKIFNAQKC